MNNYEITRFAQLFNDELTLDNLERIQLVNLCRFVGIPPFGTDAFLASRLRAHLARIKVRTNPFMLCTTCRWQRPTGCLACRKHILAVYGYIDIDAVLLVGRASIPWSLHSKR